MNGVESHQALDCSRTEGNGTLIIDGIWYLSFMTHRMYE